MKTVVTGIYSAHSSKLYLPWSDPYVLNLLLSPVVDGDFLPDEPSKLFHNAADLDYMAGGNDMDGHMFAQFDVPSINSPMFITTS